METDSSCVLELNRNPINFEPVSKVTNVFYDEVTKHIFTVRSGGATGVIVKGPNLGAPLNFRVEDRGAVLSIKFSPNLKVLAIQRSLKSVEFLNFTNHEPDGPEYSQMCRGNSASILGFVWLSDVDFIIITNQGLENYQIVSEKKSVRAVKSYSLQSNWFVYCPTSGLLVVSSSILGNCLHPFLFKNHQFLRLTKFEIDIPNPPQPARLCLLERDVTPATIYNQMMVLILRHQATHSSSGSRTSNSEIVIYSLNKDTPPRKTHILNLDVSGKLAASIVDNLIIVHHQPSKSSLIFDINLPCESNGRVLQLNPCLGPTAIRPYYLNLPSAMLSTEPTVISCEMYSPNWVFFQPNVIIDAILGCLWSLELRLSPVIECMKNPIDLFNFLLLRHDSKPTVLAALRKLLTSSSPCDIGILGRVLDRLNEAYRMSLDIDMQNQIAIPATNSLQPRISPVLVRPNVVVDQNDLYTRALSHLAETNLSNEERDRRIVAILTEYIRSLVQFHIPVQHFIYEMLIEALVRLRQFYQLHQLFQYHAVVDSKPLACLLLSLESVYPAAYQLALDMLKRISTANEEIIEILLSKNKVLSALRFARETIPIEYISARKFLESAQNTKDPIIFYGVYRFFQQRNYRLRGSAEFPKGEHCETYVRHFQSLFTMSNHHQRESLEK
nr:EOG090X028B [Cyclestheria hislopi]